MRLITQFLHIIVLNPESTVKRRYTHMITHKQLTLAEVFEDCQNKFENDKYQFLVLLDETIHLDEIVPVSFVSHFHARTGRPPYFGLFSVTQASIPEVSKMVMDARAESSFWQIGSVRSTRWSNIDCKSERQSCLWLYALPCCH